MTLYVVDASVLLVSLARTQPGWEQADRLLEDFAERRIGLAAPTLLLYEAANGLDVACRRVRALTPEEAWRAAESFRQLRIPLHSLGEDPSALLETCADLGVSAYDASYLLLSRTLGAPLVTADRKLIRSVSSKRKDVMDLSAYARKQGGG